MIVFRWNETLKEFLKTTIIGGASFLLPMALVLFILSYALRLVKRIAEPISHSLRLDQLGAAAGVGAATVLSAVVLVLIAFAAGIVARTAVGRRITDGRKALFSARWHHSHQILAAGRQAGAGEASFLVSINDPLRQIGSSARWIWKTYWVAGVFAPGPGGCLASRWLRPCHS